VFTALDLLLIAVSVLMMSWGFSMRRRGWRLGRPERLPWDWKGILKTLLGHRKILAERSGAVHLFLFWSVIIPVGVVFMAQFNPVLPRVLAVGLSLLLELSGLFLLAGVVFFLRRRIKSQAGEVLRGALAPLVLLGVVAISGFAAEGFRIRITTPGASWASPVGWMFSLVLPASPLGMQWAIRLHFLTALCLVATLPFTSLRHVAAAPLNVLYRRRAPRGSPRALDFARGPLGAGSVEDFTWKQLLEAEACVSCGRCEARCPASISEKPLSPRRIMQVIRAEAGARATGLGGERDVPSLSLHKAIKEEEVWACTTCMACVTACPVCIEPMDKILEMRRHLVLDQSRVPKEARSMVRDLELYGDVQGQGVTRRTDWALHRRVPVAKEARGGFEVLLWVGCSGAFHPRYREVARAMVRILEAGGVDYAILGREERCCGDPARRLGEEALFVDLARRNLRTLLDFSVQKIVALCPHCYNALKNEYPRVAGHESGSWDGELEVLHSSTFVLDLAQRGRIALKYPLDRVAVFQDPCYLGRVNGIYEPPRALMGSVPGIALREMERSGQEGFCCGGGGGRMWLHEGLGEHINRLRAREAWESGAGLVATACPYCLTMMEDGLRSLELEQPPRVLDIVEVVAASLGEP